MPRTRRSNANARRYSHLNYAEAEKASSGLIQAKAIHAADEEDVLIEVAALGSAEATTIAAYRRRRRGPRGPSG